MKLNEFLAGIALPVHVTESSCYFSPSETVVLREFGIKRIKMSIPTFNDFFDVNRYARCGSSSLNAVGKRTNDETLTTYERCNRRTLYYSYILQKERGPWEPSMALYYAYPSVLLTKFFSGKKDF